MSESDAKQTIPQTISMVPIASLNKPNNSTTTQGDKQEVQERSSTGPQQRIGDQSVRFRKLQKRLRRLTGQAIEQYQMIEDGDRILVCLSGGKDSYTMLDMLRSLQRKAPVNFELFAVNLDQKQPGFPEHVLPDYLRAEGQPFEILEQDTYSVVKRVIPENKTTCGLCSRLRRGHLYRYASENGFNKIALGHHRDDIIETLFLNLFHGATLKAMPPKLRSDDGKNTVIRPLALCSEADITAYAARRNFPIIPCTLCGSQPNMQRQAVKGMLQDWERQQPGRSESIFRALQNIKPSQLADASLFDFANFTGVIGGGNADASNTVVAQPEKTETQNGLADSSDWLLGAS